MSDNPVSSGAVRELTKEVRGWLDTSDAKINKAVAKANAEAEKYEDFVANSEASLKYMHDHLIDLRDEKYSDQLFYPVMIPLTGSRSTIFEVTKAYHWGNATSNDNLGIRIAGRANGGSWGGNPMHINLEHNAQTYKQGVVALGFTAHGYKLGFWMRGGHAYILRVNRAGVEPEVLDTRTEYFTRQNSPQYNLTAGPVDEATGLAHVAALPLQSNFVTHNLYAKTLGDM